MIEWCVVFKRKWQQSFSLRHCCEKWQEYFIVKNCERSSHSTYLRFSNQTSWYTFSIHFIVFYAPQSCNRKWMRLKRYGTFSGRETGNVTKRIFLCCDQLVTCNFIFKSLWCGWYQLEESSCNLPVWLLIHFRIDLPGILAAWVN